MRVSLGLNEELIVVGLVASRSIAAGCLLGLTLACSNQTGTDAPPRVRLTVTPSAGTVAVLAGDSAINTCSPNFCIDIYPDPVEPLFGYAPSPLRPLVALWTDPPGVPPLGTYPVSRPNPSDTGRVIGMELDGPSAFWEATTGSIRITHVDSSYVTGTVDAYAPAPEPYSGTEPDLHIKGSFVVPR